PSVHSARRTLRLTVGGCRRAPEGPSMARAKATTVPADRLERYDRLIATIPGPERKGVDPVHLRLRPHVELPDRDRFARPAAVRAGSRAIHRGLRGPAPRGLRDHPEGVRGRPRRPV